MALSSIDTIISRMQSTFHHSATEAKRKALEAALRRDQYDGGNIGTATSNLTLTDNTQLKALANYLGVLQSGD